ncbi:TOG array regulator of axonemal microtubules protein 1-like [Gadus macrocephalus]|uniref:TOG array regulator of axonemal microtubules protein 1-like n=1 Tax=Gadus macrocephalus TaxID=80720 RepID=UPI0028CB9599|nr:TOG array regulator of axonemal microtubules protein 1-like [Gadus macrocephalus]
MMVDYTEVTRLVPAPPTEAKPPGLNPRYPRGARLPWLAAPAGGSNERVVLRPPTEAKPPGLNPRYPRGSRLPRLAAPAGGSNERVVLHPPTEAKPPGLNPRYPRGSRLPRLAVAEEADGQEAWIPAAHSDTVSPRARALGAASSQETSPGRTPPAGGSNERVVLHPPTEAKPPGLNPRYPRGARLPRLAVAEEADGQEAWIPAAHSDTVSPRARALGAASSQETSPGRTPPEVAGPDHHRGARLPRLAAPAAGANTRIVLRPTEAKPPHRPPVSFTVDLRDAPLSSAPSSRNAAASARRRALGGAEADLSGTERSQSANGQRSQAPGRIVLRPPTEAKPPGLNPRYPCGSRLPRLAVAEEADGQEAWITAAHSDTVSPRARALGAASSQDTSPGQTPPEVADPDHPCGARLPRLAAPAAGANDRIVLRPTEAKPPHRPPVSFTVDLRDAPLSSAPSSWNAAASARRRALGGAEADLSGRERSQFANGQRSQAPGSPPASDVPEGVAGRGKCAFSPFPPVQERLRNGRIPREKLRGPPPHQAGEEAGPSGKRQKNGGRCFPDQRLTAEPELEEKLLDSRDEPAQGSLSGPQRDPPGPHPFPKPELAMTQSLTLISSENWQEKMEGLTVLRSLAQNHVDTLLPRLRDVCLALVQEVKNLRSGVSRVAVCTLGVLYCHLQRAMDKEVETTARALLHKAAESNAFIREEVDTALGHMVRHCTPARCINAFLDGGLSHLSAAVRKCAAQHLADLLERVGVARLLSGGKDVTDRILPAVVKLALDSSPEPRSFGRRMLLFLSSHRDFDSMLEKNIPTKDLSAARKAVSGLKAKGLGETPQTPASLPGSGTARASTLQRKLPKQTSREPNSKYSSKPQGPIMEDKPEYIRQLTALLESKDFRERIKGLDQLVADCQHNPSMVIRSLFPVFDLFRDRLLESNRKVNLYALEALQGMVRLLKDNLSGVLNHLVPAIVDNHLNSKNHAVYSAATGALCELVLNLDNSLLLEPFCFKARVLSGQAKVDLIEKVAELVMELYPRRPQLVEQKALPLLWGLLGPSSGSVHRATTSLCRALHHQMGPGLRQSAASQPPSVGKDLNQLLRTMS